MNELEQLERLLVEAALNLAAASMAYSFSIPIPNTTPPLFVKLCEDREL